LLQTYKTTFAANYCVRIDSGVHEPVPIIPKGYLLQQVKEEN